MRIKTISLLFFFWVGAVALSGQDTFQRYFTIADSSCGGGHVTTTSTGNIFLTGALSKTTPSANFDAIVWMLQEDGSIIWTLKFERGDATSVLVTDVKALDDGGVVLALAYYFSNSAVSSEIVRLNAQGGVVWARKLEDTPSYGIDHVAIVSGGYLLTGSFGGNNQSCILKVDPAGNTLWAKKISGVELAAYTVAEDGNGDLYLSGRYNFQGALIKLSASGAVLSARSYTEANSIQLANFTGCVKVGDSLALVGYDANDRLMVLKVDKNGAVGSAITLKSPTPAPLYVLGALTDDQGNIYFSVLRDGSSVQAIFVKLQGSLGTVWTKQYGNSTSGSVFNFYASAPSSSDQGYLLTGTYIDAGKERVYLVKTNNQGEVIGPCCPKSTVLLASPIVVETNVLDLTELVAPSFSATSKNRTFTQSETIDLCASEAQIQLSDTDTICPGQCLNISMSNPQQGATYEWAFPSASPMSSGAVNPGQVCFNAKGDYRIRLSESGCLLDSTVVTVDNLLDKFPNAFAPGGLNKTFFPIVDCPVEEYHLEVFNRWGDLVFETFEQNDGWNGDVNGKPGVMDVYIYRVQYFAVRNGTRIMVYESKREVTLLR